MGNFMGSASQKKYTSFLAHDELWHTREEKRKIMLLFTLADVMGNQEDCSKVS